MKRILSLLLSGAITFLATMSHATAEIAFVSSTSSGATLIDTIDDNGTPVFVFNGVATGESASYTFSVDSDCPMLAMTGGAKFDSPWSCSEGVIEMTLTNQGGLSFGPGTDANAGSFYITFGNPPTPPGASGPPTEMAGVQISVFGDIRSWDLSGEPSASGAAFGVELTGARGADAHFAMYLPPAGAEYLGGVLGVTVGGRADPFASVVSNEDGSVDITVDIESLQPTSRPSGRPGVKADTVTKKILASERSLSIAANKRSVRSGRSVTLAMCAGKTFVAGARVPVKYTVGGKSHGRLRASAFRLDERGCAQKRLAVPSSVRGTLGFEVKYLGRSKKGSVKVTK